MEPKVIESSSPERTRELGQKLGAVAQPGDLIALVGNLGAGKTLLVQALARGLGVPSEIPVVSPTFTLINEYDGGRARLYHADLYRIEKELELEELGLDEMCRRGDGVVVVEWADRFRVFPRDHLIVTLDVIGDEARRLTVGAGGPDSTRLLTDWLG